MRTLTVMIICLLPISALADLGKTYAECDYSSDFRRITYDSKQRVSQWLNKDWYIMETFDVNSHQSNMITYTKLNRERIRRDEMHTFAWRNLLSTGDWKSLGTIEDWEVYQTKDEKFFIYLNYTTYGAQQITFCTSEVFEATLEAVRRVKELQKSTNQ